MDEHGKTAPSGEPARPMTALLIIDTLVILAALALGISYVRDI